jgi:single-strand DNA-binding protein
MNSLRNKVNLIGRLGQTPEIRTMSTGRVMARFSIATTESYKTEKGEKKTETQWHNIVAWGTPARLVERYVKKGQEVAIEGRLTTRSYEDKNGVKRYVSEIVMNDILMLGNKEKEN